MLVKLKTFSLLGIDAVPVEVEVDCADIGMPKTILVGLPEAAVKESTYRIERAIENSGYFNPIHRTVINRTATVVLSSFSHRRQRLHLV